MEVYLVPVMLSLSSLLMAFAWLGHLRFRHKGFLTALLFSWFLVLPEYLLNVSAIRWGFGTYEANEMAAINLCTGVFFVALVSTLFLKEPLPIRKVCGFVVMCAGVILVVF
ncbi:MAG: DMT family protein [Acidobacteriota bacterium]